MNKTIFGVVGFALGAAAGSLVTWKLVKSKYERIANEEIESVKEVFSEQLAEKSRVANDMHNDEFDDAIVDPDASDELETTITDYSSYSTKSDPKPEEEVVVNKELDKERPYVISPEEFGEFEDYEQISLTFYSDHILTDDVDDILENIDEVIGFESLNHFGEYEDDSVYVRNDKFKCDYEILLDQRRYEDVLAQKTRRKGVL